MQSPGVSDSEEMFDSCFWDDNGMLQVPGLFFEVSFLRRLQGAPSVI